MRVIAGLAKRIPLITPVGLDTRPTTDRTKETLFNMLQPYIVDCNFLDLFSGSGAIGIEALSRGAEEAVFVENGQEALNCIRTNLTKTKLMDKGRILNLDVLSALIKLEHQGGKFDIVFMDPPYLKGEEEKVLTYLKDSCLIDKNTLIVVEAALETDFTYLEELHFYIDKIKKYKTNMHVFIYPEASD
ncbi:16S rRNA (guanine(966)-N(2))-methyltransferase RsmD [Anaeromicropila populeti]|uniref:16S rRNA (Guanine(966)-N(2))-methyltransferase RsmD n=1 Tax=Anaeromicropila populeti TaxID=37658 RepID=A0A1I6KIB9_9FIRM|nr:16S rRNA (guanine(966)-N(2))-methyltransferase RsmD [Anaeromicropila populeti]SFR90985.1 16S rRNA (guanine(966)-N(2))-methyltransferase RsmD [Anaeromicropila populeti]